MVQKNAPLGVSRYDRLEEDRWREESAKLRGRSSLLSSNTRMNDPCDTGIARRRFGDWLSMCAPAPGGRDQKRLNSGRFRTAFVEAYIRAQESWQREQLLEPRWQVFQINDQLSTGSRDQSGFWQWSILRMVAELDPARCFDCLFQFRVFR